MNTEINAASIIQTDDPVGGLKLNKNEWYIILLLASAFFISRYDFSLLGLALPDIQRDLQIAESDVGPFLGYARFGAVMVIPFAILADRIGRRKLLLSSILGFTISSIGTAFVSDWQTFAFFQFSARAFTAADEVLSVVFIVEEIHVRRRGLAIGILAAFGGLGEGVAAVIYPFVRGFDEGWRMLYLLAALPLFLFFLLRRRIKETGEFTRAAAAGAGTCKDLILIISLHRKKAAALAGLALVYHLPVTASMAMMPKFLQEQHAYSAKEVSILFIVAGAIALGGNIAGGKLSDIVGRRIGFSVACIAMLMGMLLFYLGPVAAVPFGWTLGLTAYLGSHVIFLALASETFPTVSRATMASAILAVGALSTALGLMIEGQLYTHFLDHRYAILALLPALGVAALLALFVPASAAAKP